MDEQRKPKSAIEESMMRISNAAVIANQQLEGLPWFKFGRRFYLQGVLFALALCLECMHEMMHKYDNIRGEFN